MRPRSRFTNHSSVFHDFYFLSILISPEASRRPAAPPMGSKAGTGGFVRVFGILTGENFTVWRHNLLCAGARFRNVVARIGITRHGFAARGADPDDSCTASFADTFSHFFSPLSFRHSCTPLHGSSQVLQHLSQCGCANLQRVHGPASSLSWNNSCVPSWSAFSSSDIS